MPLTPLSYKNYFLPFQKTYISPIKNMQSVQKSSITENTHYAMTWKGIMHSCIQHTLGKTNEYRLVVNTRCYLCVYL